MATMQGRTGALNFGKKSLLGNNARYRMFMSSRLSVSKPIAATGEAQPRRPLPRQPPAARPPIREPTPATVAPRRDAPSYDDVYLPRSLIMDKEIITRTSGKRLGYINQLYVDPARLEVVSVYLRQSMTSFGASNTDHVLLSSLRQIGDVVLVHDESAVLDPPADETYGYIRMVGTEVQTEDGIPLGKVRDYIFNPDNGQIANIRYDALGLPSIPQSLLSCYSLGWQDIVAVGPTKTIVRRGADRRAVKENEGWISEYVTALVNAVAGIDEEEGALGPAGSEAYRSDPAYAAWYELHAAEYERYYGQRLPKPITATSSNPPNATSSRRSPPQQQQQQQVKRRQQPPRQPMALPPPRSNSYRQALQPDQRQQMQRYYETVGVSGATDGMQQRRRQRDPPPFAANPRLDGSNRDMTPVQSRGAPGPSRNTQQQEALRLRNSPQTPSAAPMPSRPARPPAPPPIEPDAVISGGQYKTVQETPYNSLPETAEFAPTEE